MMKNIVFILLILTLSATISAQKSESVKVRAGSRVIDHFPFNERYRYPEFVDGRVQFKNGLYSETKLNYNLLMIEFEYIKSRDTLSIVNKKDISYIVAAQDTFLYDKGGFLEMLSIGPIRVALKQYIKLKEVVKKDSYGTASSGSATNSYGSLPMDGNFYKLAANEDLLFEKTFEYYFLSPEDGFIQFTKKNVIRLIPQKESAVKAYLKKNKVDYNSREDILRLTEFLQSL